MPKTTLGVGALPYAGQFTIMTAADHDACPDLDAFTAAAQHELQARATVTQAMPGRDGQR